MRYYPAALSCNDEDEKLWAGYVGLLVVAVLRLRGGHRLREPAIEPLASTRRKPVCSRFDHGLNRDRGIFRVSK